MKRILPIIIFFAFIQNLFAAPLVFKSTKTIKTTGSGDLTEVATFDTSKYKKIRIGVVVVEGKGSVGVIEAIEGTDAIFVQNVDVGKTRSYSIEVPPSKVRVSMKESGTYRVYVWATQ